MRNTNVTRCPVVLQMEANECGAASLGMVLGYHKKFITLEELRDACGVSRDGCSALNVVNAAGHYDLEASVYKCDTQALKEEIQYPAILFWNDNHFVVLEGFENDKAYINDPASGRYQIGIKDFQRCYSDIVIELSQTEQFKPEGKSSNVFASLPERLADSKAAALLLFLGAVGLILPELVAPFYIKIFIDELLIDGKTSWLGPLLFALFLTSFLRAAIGWIQSYLLIKLNTKLCIKESSDLLLHMLKLPLSFFYSRFSGDLANRFHLSEEIGNLLSGSIARPFLNLLSIFFLGIVLVAYSPILALIGLGMAGLNIFAYLKFSRNYQEKNIILIKEMGLLDGISTDGLMMIETIQASAGDDDFFSRWSSQYNRAVNIEHEVGLLGAKMSVIAEFIQQMNTLAVLSIGGIQVMQGELSIGTLVGFQALMASFMAPFMQLLRFGERIQASIGSFKRVDDVLKHPVETKAAISRHESNYTKLRGEICVEKICFGFSKLDTPFIDDLNIYIRPGEHIALVGASGSGKSTTLKLLAGLYQPRSGRILFDGQPKTNIPDSVFHNSVNVVEQEIFLFSGTILENLTLWNPKTPKEDVYAAARDATINNTIQQRPQAYNTALEEGGQNFSGGECQRLEIARALTTKPSVLFLDEATSALDARTEAQVMHHLRQRNMTCVFAAHRLNTIRYADRILVFHDGKIVEEGSHDELLSLNAHYTHLIQQQSA